MKHTFDWFCDKHGWRVLVIETRDPNIKVELHLNDKETLALYKFIGQNFDVESASD